MRAEPRAPAASVYVHAPFCARRCSYCDFAVQVRRVGDPQEWVAAIAGELALRLARDPEALSERLATLYVGGGTPSLLGPRAMELLRHALGPHRLDGPGLEWTAEANPESLTPELVGAWRASGVTRWSLGVQSFHDPALRWMGRLHGPDGAVRAVRCLKDAHATDFSVDLIFGLPSHLGRSWTEDLSRALDLGPSHVSLYGLTVEASTPLGRAVREGREPDVDEERYRDEFLEAHETLEAAGYEHYEVSNFARPGARSRHNQVYWSGAPYLGLGNGAHSFRSGARAWNLRSWADYGAAVAAGALPEEERETVDRAAARLEAVWLGLRTRDGLPLEDAPARTLELVRGWVDTGLAERISARRIRLTAEGWLLLDRLAVDLDATLPG